MADVLLKREHQLAAFANLGYFIFRVADAILYFPH